MADRSQLLTTREMAMFVARGFLRFDELVPSELNERFISAYSQNTERDQKGLPAIPAGTPAHDAWPEQSPLAEIFALPRLAGIIESLVGPGCLFDHHFLHIRAAGHAPSQHVHQDSTIDPRLHFDLQLMYFPKKIAREMGGTYFVPGSHFRKVNEASISRYQNIVGTKHVVCEAGTIYALHMGVWHGGGYNQTGESRLMYKVRLNPAVRQCRLWNTDDITEDTATPQPIFSPEHPHDKDDIQTILCTPERWFEIDTSRLEFLNRIKLWRFLLGDDTFDAHYWLTRLENTPS
jgi:hypothetical protein